MKPCHPITPALRPVQLERAEMPVLRKSSQSTLSARFANLEIFSRKVLPELPEVKTGDLLAIWAAGAYGLFPSFELQTPGAARPRYLSTEIASASSAAAKHTTIWCVRNSDLAK